MTTFVVAHGAWSSGFAWRKMRPLMGERGHELYVPSLTGLGERGHLSAPEVGLETHILDVVGVLEFEDLRDVVLIGHSYGGMVATGVADRVPGRLRQLVYLDAFVPADGQCLFDLTPPGDRERRLEQAKAAGETWRMVPNPMPPDTSAEDLAWLGPRRLPQPFATFEQPVRLVQGATHLPRTYIYCTTPGPGDVFRQFADRARGEPGWRCFEIDSSHSPHVTAPTALADLLDRIARTA